MVHSEQLFLHQETRTRSQNTMIEVSYTSQMVPVEIPTFTMMMAVLIRCTIHDRNFIRLVFCQDLTIRSISHVINTHLFILSQFSIHKMVLEEIHMSKRPTVALLTQALNVENTDKHLKLHLEAIIRFHFTSKREILVQQVYKKTLALPA